MSRSVNKVILLGNLGKDPELKYTASGQAVTRFSIATSERWKDKTNGEWQEKTEWHNVVCWAKLAETANQYLTKGSSVYIEGRLQTRSWDDKENRKHYSTEVIAQEMVMTGNRGAGQRAQGAASSAGTDDSSGGRPPLGDDDHALSRRSPPPTEITDDDIPF